MGCALQDWNNVGELTDTHCHLNLTIFKADLSEVLEQAWENGLQRILIPGIDLDTSQEALEICDKFPGLYAAVGIHPGSANTWTNNSLSTLKSLAEHPKAVAIGEIGLDYYRDRSPRQLQLEVFQAQLTLASELGMPVVVHNRDSFNDLWIALSTWHDRILREGLPLSRYPGVLHSFDGSIIEAQQAVNKGFFIGISGPVTYRNALKRQETAAQLDLDHVLVETDSPYLTPHPYRGRRNEPAMVTLIAEKIAELHGVKPDDVARRTGKNAQLLFHWGANP